MGRWGYGRQFVVATIAAVLVVLSASAPGQAAPGQQPSGGGTPAAVGPDVVVEWFAQTDGAVTRAALPTQVTSSRIWATSWLAALRAIDAGAHRADRSGGADGGAGRPRRTFEAAAVATAVHDTLVEWLPDQAAALDPALAATLGALPEGRAKRRGTEAGSAAAAGVLAERADDGLDVAEVNRDFTPPPEAPGVWRLTPGATRAVQAGQGEGLPFLLGRADQFLPAAPPALGTPEYRAGLDEVQRLGGTTSVERTAEQTNVGLVGRRSPVAITLDRRLDSGETLTLPYPARTRWAQLTQDNADARVWTGIHFSFSDEVGATLGCRVARHDLVHLARLTP